MSTPERIRLQHIFQEAEGYLELDMPQQAFQLLRSIKDEFEEEVDREAFLVLKGETLRALGRFAESRDLLEEAMKVQPENIHLFLALAWCHKRVDQIDLAADLMQQAIHIEPENALLHYNLACYCSLLGQKEIVLGSIRRALELDSNYRQLIDGETDFDPVRGDPDFLAAIGQSHPRNG